MVAQTRSLVQRGYTPGNPPKGLVDRLWMMHLYEAKRTQYRPRTVGEYQAMQDDISKVVADQLNG